MDGRGLQPEDFASAFEAAFARLQVSLEMACTEEGPWYERAGIAIRRGLEFAAAEPESVRVLTNEALGQGIDGFKRYERLMAYLADLFKAGRAESPYGAALPRTTERSIAGGVATIVANRVDRGRAGELLDLVPEVVQFALTPYLGTEEAKRIAASGGWPSSQSDR
jgi:hypothetical protein